MVSKHLLEGKHSSQTTDRLQVNWKQDHVSWHPLFKMGFLASYLLCGHQVTDAFDQEKNNFLKIIYVNFPSICILKLALNSSDFVFLLYFSWAKVFLENLIKITIRKKVEGLILSWTREGRKDSRTQFWRAPLALKYSELPMGPASTVQASAHFVHAWATLKLTRWVQSTWCKHSIHNLLVYPKKPKHWIQAEWSHQLKKKKKRNW